MTSAVPLPGGSAGTVVRVGDTVRRPLRPWSESVHGLLLHLQAAGFDYAPRLLGTDEHGNEVLSYVSGKAAVSRPFPPEIWADHVLVQVGEVLRRYHDAVADYRPGPHSRWRHGRGACAAGEIVCHNDLGPANVVVDQGRVRGFIDWENAQPARPEQDLAHLAWWWVPLTPPQVTAQLGGPAEHRQESRLRLLCRAYGWTDPASLLPAVRRCVEENLRHTRDGAAAGDGAHLQMRARGFVDELQATLEYLDNR